MSLSIEPLSEAEETTPRCGLGVLYHATVPTTGIDFDLTAWSGAKIAVHASAAGLCAWFEAIDQSITSTESTTAEATPTGAQATNGSPLVAGRNAPVTVPRSSADTPKVVLRVASAASTIVVRIERA